MSASGLVVDRLFHLASLVPSSHHTRFASGNFALGWTLALNIVATGVLVTLWFLARNSRHSTSVATDPICGMAVNTSAPGATRHLEHVDYYFCSPRCAERFDQRHAPASLTTSRATPWIRTEYGATLGGSRPTEPPGTASPTILQRRRSLCSSRERVQRRRASHSQDVKVFMSKQHTSVRSYGVLIDATRVALVRSSNPRHTPPLWWLPGGGIDFGEAPEDTLIREFREETGLEVQHPVLLGVTSDVRRRDNGDKIHTVRILFTVELAGGELHHEVHGTTDTRRGSNFATSRV